MNSITEGLYAYLIFEKSAMQVKIAKGFG